MMPTKPMLSAGLWWASQSCIICKHADGWDIRQGELASDDAVSSGAEEVAHLPPWLHASILLSLLHLHKMTDAIG